MWGILRAALRCFGDVRLDARAELWDYVSIFDLAGVGKELSSTSLTNTISARPRRSETMRVFFFQAGAYWYDEIRTKETPSRHCRTHNPRRERSLTRVANSGPEAPSAFISNELKILLQYRTRPAHAT